MKEILEPPGAFSRPRSGIMRAPFKRLGPKYRMESVRDGVPEICCHFVTLTIYKCRTRKAGRCLVEPAFGKRRIVVDVLRLVCLVDGSAEVKPRVDLQGVVGDSGRAAATAVAARRLVVAGRLVAAVVAARWS